MNMGALFHEMSPTRQGKETSLVLARYLLEVTLYRLLSTE